MQERHSCMQHMNFWICINLSVLNQCQYHVNQYQTIRIMHWDLCHTLERSPGINSIQHTQCCWSSWYKWTNLSHDAQKSNLQRWFQHEDSYMVSTRSHDHMICSIAAAYLFDIRALPSHVWSSNNHGTQTWDLNQEKQLQLYFVDQCLGAALDPNPLLHW